MSFSQRHEFPHHNRDSHREANEGAHGAHHNPSFDRRELYGPLPPQNPYRHVSSTHEERSAQSLHFGGDIYGRAEERVHNKMEKERYFNEHDFNPNSDQHDGHLNGHEQGHEHGHGHGHGHGHEHRHHHGHGHHRGHSAEGGGASGDSSAGGGSDGSVGAPVQPGERHDLIAHALQLAGIPVTEQNISAVNTIVSRESSWNPNSSNNWDSNARAGHPSEGLMQTIPSTFSRYALPGMNSNIHDPLSNLVAGIRYAEARYGGHGESGVAAVASRPGGY